MRREQEGGCFVGICPGKISGMEMVFGARFSVPTEGLGGLIEGYSPHSLNGT